MPAEKLTSWASRDLLIGMLIKKITITAILSVFLLGCESELIGATRIETKPVKVSGTTYQTYMLVRSVDVNYSNPLNDPHVQKAVYAIVGPAGTKGVKALTVYCGTSTAGCERAIRAFNSSTPDSEM